ncbi:MAG: excisionase family DNA-binding protein [Planctomycetota bacterium]
MLKTFKAPGPPASESEPTHFTKRQAADRWGVSVKTIDRFIQAGEIKATKFGRQVRIGRDEVHRIDVEGLAVS